MGASGINWDEADAPAPTSGIDWDAEDADQREQARDLVHGGQKAFLPNFTTAAGKSFAQTARKLVNLLNINGAGINHDPEAFGTDENIAAAEKANAPVFAAPGGTFGKVVGDTAATIPIGGPAEAGAGMLLKSALPKALEFAIPALKGAAGGAVTAASTADPGHRVAAAEEGAGVGSALGGTMQVLGRGTTGFVKKAPELENLEGDVSRGNQIPNVPQRSLFVPVSQGYDPNDATSAAIGKLYRNALPYSIGVQTQLENQTKRATDTVLSTALQRGAPEGIVVPSKAAEDMQLSTSEVKKAHDAIYNDLKNVQSVPIPASTQSNLRAKILADNPDIPESEINEYVNGVGARLAHYNTAETTPGVTGTPGQSLSGWDLKNVKDDIQGMNADLPMRARSMTNSAKDHIDSIIEDHIANGGDTGGELAKYLANKDAYTNFAPLNDAVNSAAAIRNSGTYKVGSVAPRANDMTDIQGIDQNAFKVLGKSPAQVSQAGRMALYTLQAGAGIGTHGGSLPLTLGLNTAANALATETAQKGLYGDLAHQKILTALLRSNPKLAASLGYTVRDAATSQVGED